jgi:hypothetical protein
MLCMEPDGLGLMPDERLLVGGPLLKQGQLRGLLAERPDREDRGDDRAEGQDHGGDGGDPGRNGPAWAQVTGEDPALRCRTRRRRGLSFST